MNNPKTVETQLECYSTASLKEEILKDLEQEDKPLSTLLSEDQDKVDENTNNPD